MRKTQPHDASAHPHGNNGTKNTRRTAVVLGCSHTLSIHVPHAPLNVKCQNGCTNRVMFVMRLDQLNVQKRPSRLGFT